MGHAEQCEEDGTPSLGPLCSTRVPQALCSEWFPVQGEMEGLEKEQQMLQAGLAERLGSPSTLQVHWGQSQPLLVGYNWHQRTRDVHCSFRLGGRMDILSWGRCSCHQLILLHSEAQRLPGHSQGTAGVAARGARGAAGSCALKAEPPALCYLLNNRGADSQRGEM